MDFKHFLEVKYSEKMGLNPTEIKSFLGRSVVRRPVYHGTNEQFKEFKKVTTQRFVLFSAFDVQAQGFFFSESRKDALSYGRNLITAYVRLTNPLLDPRSMPHLGVDQLPEKKEAELAFILRHSLEKHDTYGTYMDIDAKSNWVKRNAREKDYSWIYNAICDGGLQWDVLDNPLVVGAMKRFGYDGTFVHERRDYSGRSIFVMEPNQVKIVDVRRG